MPITCVTSSLLRMTPASAGQVVRLALRASASNAEIFAAG